VRSRALTGVDARRPRQRRRDELVEEMIHTRPRHAQPQHVAHAARERRAREQWELALLRERPCELVVADIGTSRNVAAR
jgi:hypothetical protein